MALTSGTRLGPYEILAPLGAGGMGEVYKARDPRLDRLAALKVLPADKVADAERTRRFAQEAKAASALNHPNVITIYDINVDQGVDYIAMEYVAGRSLDRVIPRQGLRPIDVLRYGVQIADALSAAHAAGIIHRDLKPANLMVTESGLLKVLDFGIAKLTETTATNADLPTASVAAPATDEGRILGTVAYMSPEQAQGLKLDARSDIFSLGAVLYEMLTGHRAFSGETKMSTLAAILDREPQPLVATTPRELDRVVTRCLKKDPARRFQTMADLKVALEELKEESDSGRLMAPGGTDARTTGGRVVAAAVAAAIATVSTGVAVWTLKPVAPVGRAIIARVTVSLPPGVQLEDMQFPAVALSPDATQLAYAAVQGSTRQLYIRSLDNLEVKGIAGTEDATAPFFSPDGQWIGFFAAGKLKTVSITGGALQTLWNAPLGVGGSWGPDNTIYFAPTAIASLWKIPASGGTAQPVTTLDRSKGEVSHRWPQVLPGGKAVLFTVWTGPGFDEMHFEVQSLETGERQVLWSGGETGRYVSTGHLVYTRGDALMAVSLDLARLKVTSSAPVVLAEAVWTGAQGAHYAVSDSGALAYVPGNPHHYERRLVWVDRKGDVEPLPVPPRAYGSPQLSPDGRRAAVEVWEGTVGIWVYDFGRATLTPLTSGGSSQQPTWTPDGKRIAYRGTRTGFRNVFWKAADGTGEEERLTTGENNQTPTSWSPDGKWLAFADLALTTGNDIWLVRPEGDRTPQIFLRTPSNERDGRFSPDGRWLAYASNATGREQIWVRPFPGPGETSQISTSGGTEPVWSRDGRELFYLSGDKMMAVDIATRPTLTAGSPRLLFEGRYDTSVTNTSSYDVSIDGRFLRAQPPASQALTQLQVVINWGEELKQRVPMK